MRSGKKIIIAEAYCPLTGHHVNKNICHGGVFKSQRLSASPCGREGGVGKRFARNKENVFLLIRKYFILLGPKGPDGKSLRKLIDYFTSKDPHYVVEIRPNKRSQGKELGGLSLQIIFQVCLCKWHHSFRTTYSCVSTEFIISGDIIREGQGRHEGGLTHTCLGQGFRTFKINSFKGIFILYESL